jgi:CubicO group peptidase (beta-lactamase class C family)
MHCAAVVKDGALVMNQRYGAFGSEHTRIESMSAGKTITAALIGAAVQSKLFDLDTPLHTYGVNDTGIWARNSDKVQHSACIVDSAGNSTLT